MKSVWSGFMIAVSVILISGVSYADSGIAGIGASAFNATSGSACPMAT